MDDGSRRTIALWL